MNQKPVSADTYFLADPKLTSIGPKRANHQHAKMHIADHHCRSDALFVANHLLKKRLGTTLRSKTLHALDPEKPCQGMPFASTTKLFLNTGAAY